MHRRFHRKKTLLKGSEPLGELFFQQINLRLLRVTLDFFVNVADAIVCVGPDLGEGVRVLLEDAVDFGRGPAPGPVARAMSCASALVSPLKR